MSFLREIVSLVTPFIPLLTALIWPIMILIILNIFKEGIGGQIKSLAEARIGDRLVFKFWQAKSDLLSAEPPPAIFEAPSAPESAKLTAAPSDARWDRVANFFWLGSDLDWTAQTVLRGAPKERIVHGLTQSCHHAAQCGLSQSVPGQQLDALRSQVQSMQESALERDWRANFAEQIYVVIRGFSDLARGHQPDFRPGP